MKFELYLTEAKSDELSVDEFIESIKKDGLYGYDVLKHFNSEEDLRNTLTDDNYFNSNTNKDGTEIQDEDSEKKLSEMVVRKNGKTVNDVNTKDDTLSLAVRLGLKNKINNGNKTKEEEEKPFIIGKPNQEKPKPQSFADKMREFAEQKRKEQQERAEKEKALRDQRAREAEERNKKSDEDKPEITFNGQSQYKRLQQDDKIVDKKLADIEKELEKEMFKRTRASTKVDDQGYKSVKNLSRISDAEAEKKLAREMAKKFPSKEEIAKKKARLGNSDQAVEKEEHIMSRNEYSKRTLCAIADKNPNFKIYCKYRKLNGDIRTGHFTLIGTKSQVTWRKLDTIVAIDDDLSKKENKTVYRTINLFKILEIKPL